jgi:hypothetical protein
MAEFVLTLAGFIVALFVLAYVLHAVFIPLFRTVGGGFKILSIYVSGRSEKAGMKESPAFMMHDMELGPTMADGGEKTGNSHKNV